MFPLQAQLRRELNEEKFKNEVLTKLVYMYVYVYKYLSVHHHYIVKYQYQLSTGCVHITCKYGKCNYGKPYNYGQKAQSRNKSMQFYPMQSIKQTFFLFCGRFWG